MGGGEEERQRGGQTGIIHTHCGGGKQASSSHANKGRGVGRGGRELESVFMEWIDESKLLSQNQMVNQLHCNSPTLQLSTTRLTHE